MIVKGSPLLIFFELMLPSNYRLRVLFPHVLNVVEDQMTIIVFGRAYPAKQLSFLEVCNFSCIKFEAGIQPGPGLFMGLQIDEPYFVIPSVPNHNLFWTDHQDGNSC